METSTRRVEPEEALSHVGRVLERVLTGYHRAKRHGGADRVTTSELDGLLAATTERAFRRADRLPPDAEVLRILEDTRPELLGEGYHVVTLCEPAHRFVVKYAKSSVSIPPLAPRSARSDPRLWATDHGVGEDGRLHEAIWQHIRAFESYGQLTVPNRVYFAGDVLERVDGDERRALDRFRALGIVRLMGDGALRVHPHYLSHFPDWKRPPEGSVAISAMVVQPWVTRLVDAIERDLRAGNQARVRGWEDRYRSFVQQLWRHGVSHLDFSILNVGVTNTPEGEQLVIFDPHMGEIELSAAGAEVEDPMARRPEEQRGLEDLLRGARDGSRWALWRIQERVAVAPEVSRERVSEAAEIVRAFHVETGGGEAGEGVFSRSRFGSIWHQQGVWEINDVALAQLRELVRHPLGERVTSVLEQHTADEIYNRRLVVRSPDGESDLAQFRAGLRVYQQRPLLVVANVSDDALGLAKLWGRVPLPPELDIQDDPSIHYHLRDLLTGEVYVRSGESLARDGIVVGLAPHELHALQIEDIAVEDMIVERALAGAPDFSGLLRLCKKTVAAVGDIHGESQALKEALRALRFVDSSDHWFAGEATLVLTGDVGHGTNLQEAFDYIRRLAAQAHSVGGRIVWTLGNHDLYADTEGGQGGSDSLGYRLWPQVREIALHPERSAGLTITAAYHSHGKVFVHGGVLPDVARMAEREHGARDARSIVGYVNDVFREAIASRERIHAGDLPHEIFRVGTSHAREPRLPGESGYEAAGIFTPDLRELDHYRHHDRLLPQIVGHTASRTGRIRYSPSSRLRRDYIAIDVGRQHGLGNGGLFLTELGWMAVTPGEPTRLVEASTLFIQLAHEAARTEDETWPDARRQAHVLGTVAEHLRAAKSESRPFWERREDLFKDLPADQVIALVGFFASIRETGRSVLVTDLDDTLTAFFGSDLEDDTIQVLADYLAAGGGLVFNTGAPFDWFYQHVVRGLVTELGADLHVLRNVPLILSGGNEIYVFEEGAYRLRQRSQGGTKADGLAELVRLSRQPDVLPWNDLDPDRLIYLGDSYSVGGIDESMAGAVGIVINVGEPIVAMPGRFLNLVGGYRRAIDVFAIATAALKDSGRATPPAPDAGTSDAVLWTFADKNPPPGRRVRVRVGGSGYVHAGVAHPDGRWDPLYNVPLIPQPDGSCEALLPPRVSAFTFFWTEPPRSPGHPGHWEREGHGGRVFTIAGGAGGGIRTGPDRGGCGG
jgi:Calcineurin-like phosphoesterase